MAVTTTSSGLTVRAYLVVLDIARGITISGKHINVCETQGTFVCHEFHGEWDYALNLKSRHVWGESS